MDKLEDSGTLALSAKNLDPDGEVIFKLADGSEVQVSSRSLSLASPVFRTMFSSKFAEGCAVTSASACNVPLPEDDPSAVTLLCMILHHRPEVLEVTVGSKLMSDMATLADKYDCASSLALWSRLVLGERIRTHHEHAFLDGLLFPTIVFDEPEYFQTVTKRMVYTMTHNGHGAYHGVPTHIRLMLPKRLTSILIAKHLSIKQELLERLENVVKDLLMKPWPERTGLNKESSSRARSHVFELPYHHKTLFSECNSNNISASMKEMYHQGLWNVNKGLPSLSLKRMLIKLGNCRFSRIPHVRVGSSSCETCTLDLDARGGYVRSWGEAAFRGLCLDCVKYGDKGRSGGCRIVHPGGPEPGV